MAEDKEMSDFKAASLASCKPLSENMQEWRRKRNLTQADMAKKTGIAMTSICKYEENKSKIPVHALIKYSEVLNVPVSELVGEEQFFKIDDQSMLTEFHNLSDSMQHYIYEMIREMNKR